MLLLLIAMLPLSSFAFSKKEADQAYLKGDYQKAIYDYEYILRSGESAEVYYNLGNAYYRIGNITRSVLNYERAHLLDPSDEDIKFNLEFARGKTIDKIEPEGEMFFVTWYKALVNITSVGGWGIIAIVSIILVIGLTLLYLFAGKLLYREIGFYGGISFIGLFILANIFGYHQKQILSNRTGAIVILSEVEGFETPSNGSKKQFVIHEGTRVDIMDKTMSDWRQVRLGDGREGWIRSKSIEEI